MCVLVDGGRPWAARRVEARSSVLRQRPRRRPASRRLIASTSFPRASCTSHHHSHTHAARYRSLSKPHSSAAALAISPAWSSSSCCSRCKPQPPAASQAAAAAARPAGASSFNACSSVLRDLDRMMPSLAFSRRALLCATRSGAQLWRRSFPAVHFPPATSSPAFMHAALRHLPSSRPIDTSAVRVRIPRILTSIVQVRGTTRSDDGRRLTRITAAAPTA